MNNLKCFKSFIPPLLCPGLCQTTAKRTAVVLKRRVPTRLHKIGQTPKIFRSKDFVYDVVKHEDREKTPNIDVILTTYVEGLGQAGEIVSIRPYSGYEKLVAPGLAAYITPENLQKYSGLATSGTVPVHSSKFSLKTLKLLALKIVGVPMNDTNPWTLQAWNVKAGFRIDGVTVPESAIEMPPREITGPHKEQHRREFYVTITISETERVKVRCRIYLTGINSDPVHKYDWTVPSEPLFEEYRPVLESMPQPSELSYAKEFRLLYNI